MTSNLLTRKSFSYKESYSVRIASGAVDTQLVRMPWAPPAQRLGIIRKILVTTNIGGGGTLAIWDSDLSNTTIPTAGSAGAALLPLEITASAASGVASKTTIYTQDQLPEIKFNAGITCQSSVPATTVAFEVEYI